MPNHGFKHSEETKLKMSLVHMGKHLSEETRQKISNSNKGKHHSPETIKRIAEKNKGRKHTPETRAKMSAAQRGEKNHMYGTHMSEEHKAKLLAINLGRKKTPDELVKLSNARKGKPPSRACIDAAAAVNRGKTTSLETKMKLSIARATQIITEETRIKISKANGGERNPNWRGGLSFEPYCPKWTEDLRKRVRAFFDQQCVMCGYIARKGERRHSVHHVEYNKSACCDGKLVTFASLCNSCHIRTNHDRGRWEAMLHRIIDEIYDGRSYYTKEEMKEIEDQRHD